MIVLWIFHSYVHWNWGYIQRKVADTWYMVIFIPMVDMSHDLCNFNSADTSCHLRIFCRVLVAHKFNRWIWASRINRLKKWGVLNWWGWIFRTGGPVMVIVHLRTCFGNLGWAWYIAIAMWINPLRKNMKEPSMYDAWWWIIYIHTCICIYAYIQSGSCKPAWKMLALYINCGAGNMLDSWGWGSDSLNFAIKKQGIPDFPWTPFKHGGQFGLKHKTIWVYSTLMGI